LAKGKRDLAREQYWREILARFSDSGKTRAQFCKDEGHKVDLFCYWTKVIPQRDAELKQARASVKKKAPAAFVPVTVTDDICRPIQETNKRQAVAQINFSGGSVLLFENVDFALLKSLLQALKETAQ
jgi:hypothetical protein